MGNKVVFWTVFLLCVMGKTDACSCQVTHPQNRICGMRYALVGKVLSKTTGNPGFQSVVYKMEVVNRIKSPAVGQTINLKTAPDSAGCGVFYHVGSVQFVLADSGKGINSCLNIFVQTGATWSYIHGNRRDNSYIKNCKCKVLEGTSRILPFSCRLPLDPEKRRCYFRQGLCVRKQTSCVWKNDEACK